MVDDFDTQEKRKSSLWHTKKRAVHTGHQFRVKALAPCKAIVLNPQGILRVSELPKVQEYLESEYRIVVINPLNLKKINASPPAPKLICLELHPDDQDGDNGHYNLIINNCKVPSYFNRTNFCVDCWLPSNSKGHVYPDGYKRCGTSPACLEIKYPQPETEDKDYFRKFYGKKCFENHKKNGTCRERKKCRKCWVEYTSHDKHKCYH